MEKLPVGLQIYSVRDYAQKDFKDTIIKVAEMGYDFVELAGLYGKTAGEIKAILDEVGIPALSAHVPFADLVEDMEGTINDYHIIGCKYIAIPYLPEESRPMASGFDEVMKLIPKIGQICKEKGMILLYHNHDFEFVKMNDGEYGLDYMYRNISSDLLQTEIDTCWVNVAGESPDNYIRKYENRCPIVHLKDFVKFGNVEKMYALIGIDDEEESEGEKGYFEFRPVGFGMQVIPEIVTASIESGAKYFVVEQDESVGRTPMEAVKMSREYLKLLGN